MHVVIVDDEKILSKSIESQLLKHDYSVSLISSYKDFLKNDFPKRPDLFLIDISLGDGSGFDIIKDLKSNNETQNIPVIFISGHGDINTKVEGLDLGADDYIVKPFESAELLARIRKCFRSTSNDYVGLQIQYKNILFDTNTRKVYIDNTLISLSRKEKQLLELFLLNQGSCIPKKDLEEKFWDNKKLITPVDNTINVTICNLRKKLGDTFHLETIVGEGYCLS